MSNGNRVDHLKAHHQDCQAYYLTASQDILEATQLEWWIKLKLRSTDAVPQGSIKHSAASVGKTANC
jgi:hypothetical protein